MSDVSAVKALVFDVFGTVVDWRTSLINDFTKWSETLGIKADWTALVDGWRAVYCRLDGRGAQASRTRLS